MFRREHVALGHLSGQPLLEAFGDGVGKRREDGLLFEGKSDEGDEVSETPGLGASFYLVIAGAGLEGDFAQGNAAAGTRVELFVVLHLPSAQREHDINPLTRFLFRGHALAGRLP